MVDVMQLIREDLLKPAGLEENQLETVLKKALRGHADYADLYFQALSSESWVLEDSVVKEGSFHIDHGVGVRVVEGEKTGFAYTDDIQFTALQEAADAARGVSGGDGSVKVSSPVLVKQHSLYSLRNPLHSWTDQQKIQFLKQMDEEARRQDPAVKQVIASLAAQYEYVFVIASDGTMAVDVRPLVRFNVTVIVERNGRREQGYAGGGGRTDLDTFIQQDLGRRLTHEAVRQALINLEARPAPAGMMPVVLGPGWPAVLLHEAIGHGLEGDFNRRGSSAFSGRIGERVASPGCTIVDDGTLPNRRGSLSIDDEGTPSQRTVLIENGILKGYLFDKLNARLMGVESTGNGRRESYSHIPMPRMTNTYMLPGKYHPEEIIASIEKGIYAVNFAGGQVDITSGKFVFSASEAYWVEQGKIKYPVKGATLIGNGPDILTKVTMVGNDLQLDEGVGTCGKDGQSVPVGVGQPTLLLSSITVGGTV